jgi:methyl-accepting chemotaxis protein
MFGWQRSHDRANMAALRDVSEPAARQTMTPTRSCDMQARQLSAVAQTIEGFASLIGDITGQIDQLNATIESACTCEGEFSAIAGEVRTLVGQVRQSADAIATAVAASNGISSGVVAALEGIKDAIHRINALMADAAAAELMSLRSLQSQQRSRYGN